MEQLNRSGTKPKTYAKISRRVFNFWFRNV